MPTYAHIQTDQAVDTYHYLDDLADIHRVTLIQRLYGSPEMAEIMLEKNGSS